MKSELAQKRLASECQTGCQGTIKILKSWLQHQTRTAVLQQRSLRRGGLRCCLARVSLHISHCLTPPPARLPGTSTQDLL